MENEKRKMERAYFHLSYFSLSTFHFPLDALRLCGYEIIGELN